MSSVVFKHITNFLSIMGLFKGQLLIVIFFHLRLSYYICNNNCGGRNFHNSRKSERSYGENNIKHKVLSRKFHFDLVRLMFFSFVF